MIPPKNKPEVNIDDVNGNAFGILGTVKKALKKAGADEEYITKYRNEATAGDYDHLLQISMNYVEFI